MTEQTADVVDASGISDTYAPLLGLLISWTADQHVLHALLDTGHDPAGIYRIAQAAALAALALEREPSVAMLHLPERKLVELLLKMTEGKKPRQAVIAYVARTYADQGATLFSAARDLRSLRAEWRKRLLMVH